MPQITLRALTKKDEIAFRKGANLFKDMEPEWYSFIWNEEMKYEDHLDILDKRFHGINLKEGFVPDSMLYAFLDGVIIGRSSIRHELNTFLLSKGGNIGYCVATPYRNKGIATEILKQSLVYCKNILKLEKVLVTCDDENAGSFKTIEKNNGVLEDRYVHESGTEITRRYWIKL